MGSRYKAGDTVKVVNYGHLFWEHKNVKVKLDFPIVYEDEHVLWKDMSPEIIGKTGIISEVKKIQGQYEYCIEGIPEKHAWYYEDQLEMVIKKQVYIPSLN